MGNYSIPTGTFLHPFVMIAVLIASILILKLPRKHAIYPLLFVSVFVPIKQRIVVFGLDFMIFRIVILVGWLRIIFRSEHKRLKINDIDKVFILWVISHVVIYSLRKFAWGDFIYQLGFLYNTIGLYFLFRILIQTSGEIEDIIKIIGIILIILAVFMISERATGNNIFSIFGGVHEIPIVRGEKFRAQGPFSVCITAGAFGAVSLPLFLVLWNKKGMDRFIALIGIIASIIIVITSNSSTPLAICLAGIVGLSMWPLRAYIKSIRWGIYLSLLFLHLIMKAPVWALIGRARLISGSSGYHRYMLIDHFINRIDEWWLLGVDSTSHWGYQMHDVVNQYVGMGINGGILTLCIFIYLLILCFRSIGASMQSASNLKTHFYFWIFGSILFANFVGLIGIVYFDQSMVAWYMLLALISTITDKSFDLKMFSDDVS